MYLLMVDGRDLFVAFLRGLVFSESGLVGFKMSLRRGSRANSLS